LGYLYWHKVEDGHLTGFAKPFVITVYMHSYLVSLLVLLSLTFIAKQPAGVYPPNEEDVVALGLFSHAEAGQEELPEIWEKLTFRRLAETKYTLVEDEGRTIVKARSENSSSGLVRRKEVDLMEHPVMRWSWKTEQLIAEGNVSTYCSIMTLLSCLGGSAIRSAPPACCTERCPHVALTIFGIPILPKARWWKTPIPTWCRWW